MRRCRMRLFRHCRSRTLALTAVVFGALATARPAAAAVPPKPASSDVSESAIAASNQKVNQAYQALVALWSRRFAELGERFEAPVLYSYRGTVRTSCGVMSANN